MTDPFDAAVVIVAHNAEFAMPKRVSFPSILRSDSVFFYPDDGPYAGRGPRRKYGERLDPTTIPAHFLKQTTVVDKIETNIFQIEVRHKTFDQPLNVVVMVKRHLTTGKQSHAFLFSSDRTLDWDVLCNDYHLRFQIEFTFRDAKQYWGLEDFMVIRKTAVTNAMNLAFFMVNLSRCLMRDRHGDDPKTSVLDRKNHYRGLSYAKERIKLLPEKPEQNLFQRILAQVTGLGRIHPFPKNPHTK